MWTLPGCFINSLKFITRILCSEYYIIKSNILLATLASYIIRLISDKCLIIRDIISRVQWTWWRNYRVPILTSIHFSVLIKNLCFEYNIFILIVLSNRLSKVRDSLLINQPASIIHSKLNFRFFFGFVFIRCRYYLH